MIRHDLLGVITANAADRALVAVSGGADSVAMLHMLLESGLRKLVVCHLDHRLRGRSSTADARFVSKLAESLGLRCETGRADVKAMMRASGESLETAARRARHAFFAECARRHRCHRVFLGHHADDQAETVLWNLLRGSRDLKGMKAEQPLTVGGRKLVLLRPMLGLRHHEQVEWLRSRKLRWREDSSNREPVAVRNRLRHEVMPLLDQISGRDAAAALTRCAADAAERDAVEAWALAAADLLDPQGRLHLPALRMVPPALQMAAIRAFLSDHGVPGVDRCLLDRAVLLADPAHPASINLPGGRRLRRSGGRLWIEPQRFSLG